MKNLIYFLILNLPIISFSQDTIPNSSFENWSIVDSSEVPDQWPVIYNVNKESPGYQSDYAIKLKVDDSTGFENIVGLARTDFIPVTSIPYKLSGVVKTFIYPNVNDTVYVKLIGYSNKNYVFTQKWFCDSTITSYTPIEIIIDSSGNTEIDSIAIQLESGCCDAWGGSSSGTYLIVDDLKLEFYPDEVDYINTSKKSELIIYPNPTNSKIHIKKGNNNIKTISLTDINGKQLETYPFNSTEIDISTLTKGVYFFKIETDKGVLTERVIKE